MYSRISKWITFSENINIMAIIWLNNSKLSKLADIQESRKCYIHLHVT